MISEGPEARAFQRKGRAKLSSRYLLHGIIGRGGMGVVYEATDRLTGERVAYKQVTMSGAAFRDPDRPASEAIMELRLALANEFRILASLRHPNIISVLDYGFDQMGNPYYTMAYLDTARSFTKQPLDLTVDERLDMIRQLLQAMIYLHHRNVLHRDLKPANVLITDGHVRVLDFGLASLKGQDSNSVGSWSYVAPELIYGKPASESSDLYAVGVMAYELMAGHHPFDIDSPFFMEQILSEAPSFSDIDIADDVREFLDTMLSKEPTDRYPNAATALRQLNAIMDRHNQLEDEAIRDSFLQSATFVGRQQEMAQLVDALEKARNGQGSFWLLGGESGVGKTRLVNEIRTRALVEGAIVSFGQAEDGLAQPYQLWNRVVQQLALNIELDNLNAGVLQTIVPNLNDLLSQDFPTPPQIGTDAARQRLISAVSDLFVYQQGWLLLILDDLQWANESLAILEQLGRLASTLPLLIIGSYRSEDRPELPERFPEAETLILDRFSTKETAELSEAMLGDVGNQKNVLALLQRETEGNAFFVVEVVRALADQAGNLRDIGLTPLPDRLFPERIASIVQRRLSKLSADNIRLLPAAALIGREIDLAILEAIAAQSVFNIDLEIWLSNCASAAILEVNEGRWRFTHDKIRDGVLDTLTVNETMHWHKTIAANIENIYPDQPAYSAQLADHYRAVGNSVKEREYAHIAGTYAAGQFAHEISLHYLSRAINLTTEEETPLLYQLLSAREQIYDLQGSRDEQMDDLRRMGSIAEALETQGYPRYRPEFALRIAHYAESTGDYDAAVAAASEGFYLAEKIDAGDLEAASQLAIGKALIRQGNIGAANEALMRGLEGARANRDTKLEADCHRFLGVSALEQGQNEVSTTRLRQALTLYRIVNDKEGESSVLNNLGVTNFQDRIAEGLIYWTQASAIFQEIGDRLGMARVLTNLGVANSDLGEYETATKYTQQALQLSLEINVPLGVCFNLISLSLTEFYQGNFEESG